MRIAIATPAAAGTTRGNRLTAQRYAEILRELGHTVRVVQQWTRGDHDLLIALHAVKSASSVHAFRRAHPERPIVLVLTGTDVHGVGTGGARARRSSRDALRLATHVVTLQPETRRELEAGVRAKTTSIVQSAEAPRRSKRASRDGFEVVALGHLRAEKDPFVLADAVDLLPPESRVRAVHLGEALAASIARQARARSARSARWSWIGPRTHARSLARLAAADVFAQTSVVEGGSLALSEAIVCGVPILATRIPAAVGMLGARHPGFFPVGDAVALSRWIARVEHDASFRASLRAASRRLAPQFSRARERAAWRKLLARLPHTPK